MSKLFNYKTIDVILEKFTRTVYLDLHAEKSDNLSLETLFELEGLLAWLAGHVEINSVVVSSTGESFSEGFDQQEISRMDTAKITTRHLKKLQKIVYGLFFLPQTIIFDLKKGASTHGFELSLGADLRICDEEAIFENDHLKRGQVPACGGIGFLSLLMGPSFARNWTLGGEKICGHDLKTSGYILKTYATNENRREVREKILKSIKAQAPVARIQAKRSFLENLMPELDRSMVHEKNCAHASFSTGDWKKYMQGENQNFCNPRELSKVLGEKSQSRQNDLS